MVNTDKTSFESRSDWIPVSESDLVFSGNVIMRTTGWSTINFDTPFSYDGSSNVALVVDGISDEYTSSRTFSTDENQAIYIYGYSINYDPYNPSAYMGTLMNVKNQVVFGILSYHFTNAGTWSEPSNWQGGALPETTNAVFIDAPCQLDQNATVAALTISDGQSLTLQSGKTLTVIGNLTNTMATNLVVEDSAQLVHNSTNVQATVKKHITPFNGTDDGWHLIALPLTGSLEVEMVDNLLEGEYDLYGYDESTAYWMNSKHPGDGITALEAAKGYLYASGEEVTLEFAGTLENGSATITVPLSYTDEADFSGFNLVGNPFPCNAYLDREYYVMSDDGTGINPVAVSSDTPIPPCTAVFVKALAEGDNVVFTKVTY